MRQSLDIIDSSFRLRTLGKGIDGDWALCQIRFEQLKALCSASLGGNYLTVDYLTVAGLKLAKSNVNKNDVPMVLIQVPSVREMT